MTENVKNNETESKNNFVKNKISFIKYDGPNFNDKIDPFYIEFLNNDHNDNDNTKPIGNVTGLSSDNMIKKVFQDSGIKTISDNLKDHIDITKNSKYLKCNFRINIKSKDDSEKVIKKHKNSLCFINGSNLEFLFEDISSDGVYDKYAEFDLLDLLSDINNIQIISYSFQLRNQSIILFCKMDNEFYILSLNFITIVKLHYDILDKNDDKNSSDVLNYINKIDVTPSVISIINKAIANDQIDFEIKHTFISYDDLFLYDKDERLKAILSDCNGSNKQNELSLIKITSHSVLIITDIIIETDNSENDETKVLSYLYHNSKYIGDYINYDFSDGGAKINIVPYRLNEPVKHISTINLYNFYKYILLHEDLTMDQFRSNLIKTFHVINKEGNICISDSNIVGIYSNYLIYCHVKLLNKQFKRYFIIVNEKQLIVADCQNNQYIVRYKFDLIEKDSDIVIKKTERIGKILRIVTSDDKNIFVKLFVLDKITNGNKNPNIFGGEDGNKHFRIVNARVKKNTNNKIN